MKRKLIITGAFGLVGSNICKILERDYPNVEITKVKFDEWVSIVNQSGRVNGFDYIIHAAGYGQPQKFSDHKIQTLRVNTYETDQLFSVLNKDGKFLYISSSEV